MDRLEESAEEMGAFVVSAAARAILLRLLDRAIDSVEVVHFYYMLTVLKISHPQQN